MTLAVDVQHNGCLVRVSDDGRVIYFFLSASQAKHLADLLSPAEARS